MKEESSSDNGLGGLAILIIVFMLVVPSCRYINNKAEQQELQNIITKHNMTNSGFYRP